MVKADKRRKQEDKAGEQSNKATRKEGDEKQGKERAGDCDGEKGWGREKGEGEVMGGGQERIKGKTGGEK